MLPRRSRPDANHAATSAATALAAIALNRTDWRRTFVVDAAVEAGRAVSCRVPLESKQIGVKRSCRLVPRRGIFGHRPRNDRVESRGTAGLSSEGGGGVSVMTRIATSIGVPRSNADLPVAHS